MADLEKAPLLQKQDEKRKICSGKHTIHVIVAGLTSFALVVAFLYMHQPEIQEQSKTDDVVPAPDVAGAAVADYVVKERWTAGSGRSTTRLEEHYIYSMGGKDRGESSQIFLKEAYSYWRFGLAPRGGTVQVDSFRYYRKDAFESALDQNMLSSGAMVFLSVTKMALDRELLSRDDPAKLESLCVYTHTPDLMLRSSLLRKLFSYPKPLVLVLAGDSACRLMRTFPNNTRHAVVFPNDGARIDQSLEDVMWFPEGLEGIDSHSSEFWKAADARKLVDAPSVPLSRRSFLVDCTMSVNGRKPSRIALIKYLEQSGGAYQLAKLADEAKLSVRIDATVVDEESTSSSEDKEEEWEYRSVHFGKENPRNRTGSNDAVFMLAPAGDTWTSGRVLEALLKGSIPVVDATYANDGGESAKGCGDAAAVWRDGVISSSSSRILLRGAPFVFVERWEDLADALRDFGAANETLLEERLRDVRDYRAELETYLRTRLIGFATKRQKTKQHRRSTSSQCHTVPLTGEELQAQIDAESEYYARPDWFDSFVDKASYPTGSCTTTFHTVADEHGGLPRIPRNLGVVPCFDSVCAPSTVKAFVCGS